MTMLQGFLEPAELARASLRAAPTAQLAMSPENCRNHPAATRIGRSYGESRLNMIAVPEIETDRLRLRGHRLDDFDDALAMWSDPTVTRFIGVKPSSEQQTWSRLLGYAGHWAMLGFGYWALEEKASGRFVGELGFADFRRDIDTSMRNAPELGWALTSRVHGKGYATEAVRAAIAWGDTRFGSARTVCLINPDNVASIRVAEKCGYQKFKQTLFNDQPILFFERIA
jgi:RimJ/RimL family protein N-acetyltransferase